MAEEINSDRLSNWNLYYEMLKPLQDADKLQLPVIPEECTHNGHMFYIVTRNLEERSALISFLREKELQSVFHYVPLHSAKAGLKYGRFHGEDRYTTKVSNGLLRLPMYYGLKAEEVTAVCRRIKEFYK